MPITQVVKWSLTGISELNLFRSCVHINLTFTLKLTETVNIAEQVYKGCVHTTTILAGKSWLLRSWSEIIGKDKMNVLSSCVRFWMTYVLCFVFSLVSHHNPLLSSRDEATLYEGVSVRPSVRPSVGWSVTLSLFGLLGATYGRVSGLVLDASASL